MGPMRHTPCPPRLSLGRTPTPTRVNADTRTVEELVADILDLVSWRHSETEREGWDTYIEGADQQAVEMLRLWLLDRGS